LVDVILEIVDARLPKSSRNPFVAELLHNKGHVIVFNKSDLADKALTKEWAQHYEADGTVVVTANCLTGEGVSAIEAAVRAQSKEKVASYKKKGVLNVVVRAMVIGIPNTGKSTLINRYAGKNTAKTEDRPGVTRNRRWIKVKKDFELLDTPGILWGRFEEELTGIYIALTGGIIDRIIDIYTLAVKLIEILCERYPHFIAERYNVVASEDAAGTLVEIGRKRGYLLKGGEIDTERTAVMLIDEFRAGKLGRVTLDELGGDDG